MRTDYINNDTIGVLLWALTPADKLICEIMLQTGWRVEDVLNIKTEQVVKALNKKRTNISIIEQKTGKKSTKYIPREILSSVQSQAGTIYAFEHRDDFTRHRTRQAVYSDLKRVAKKFGLKINLAPHSMRKNYAVYIYNKTGDMQKVQSALNHDNQMVTVLYALSDQLLKKQK